MQLDNYVAVYVPSFDLNGVELDYKKRTKALNEVCATLSNCFGGCTNLDAQGCWINGNGLLIVEDTTLCKSFCSVEQLTDNLTIVKRLCQTLAFELNQECVSLEINNKLEFITSSLEAVA